MTRRLTLVAVLFLTVTASSCIKTTRSRSTISTSVLTLDSEPSANGLASIEGKIIYRYILFKRPDHGSKIYLVSLTNAQSPNSIQDLFKNKTFEIETDREGKFKFTNLPKDKYLIIIRSDNVVNDITIQSTRSAENLVKLEPVLNNVNKVKDLLEKKSVVVAELDLSGPYHNIINQDFGHNN